MVDDKENIIKIEIADELVSNLNLDEILQYYVRQLLEWQLKGGDCTGLQNRLGVLKRTIFREKHRRWLLENNKSFYFENPIVLQTTKQDNYAEQYFVKLNDLSGKWKSESREIP